MRRSVTTTVEVLLVALDAGVILAPSLVLAGAAQTGGLPDSHGLDLVGASAVIASVHAGVVWRRLRREVDEAGRVVDVWIAALDSVVVLAIGATLLLLLILGGFAEQHAALVNQGWPVLGLWIGVQALAVAIGEVSGRAVFRWLEPRSPGPPSGSPRRRGGRRSRPRGSPAAGAGRSGPTPGAA